MALSIENCMASYEYEGFWLVRRKSFDPISGPVISSEVPLEFVCPLCGYVDNFGPGGRCARCGATLHNPESGIGRQIWLDSLKEKRERQALARGGEPLQLHLLMPDDPASSIRHVITPRSAIVVMYETYHRIISLIKENSKKAVQYRVSDNPEKRCMICANNLKQRREEDNCCAVLFIAGHGFIDITDSGVCKFYE
jgi:hypothetical protein